MPFDVYKSFMPECFLDTNLVEVLLNKPDSVNHKKGNSTIAVQMKTKLANNFVVALIDDDKRKLKELEEFGKVERLWRPGLRLFTHHVRKHNFIQLSPAIERWILTECEKGGITLSDYDLPDSIDKLKDLKGISQRKDARFNNLFRMMLQNEKCDEISELHRWLIFFRDNHYNTNIDSL
jgi:hypothetical protein